VKLESESKNWYLTGGVSFVFLIIVTHFWPHVIPFGLFQFWKNNNIYAGVNASWPIFLWGTSVTAIYAIFTLNSRETNGDAEKILWGGFIISAIVGVFEEIIFRWILFLTAIIGVKISNFILCGLIKWLHLNFFGVIINFITLKKMSWLIFGMGWSVGAAALVANAKFRGEHAYLGVFGYFNSWFIGFFLFWIMFKYGIITAITVHFLYDMLIFIVRYVDAAIERSLGLHSE